MQQVSRSASPPQHRLYYGWYVVGACNFVAMMTWGIGVFNQGVFLGYFGQEYGWTRAALSIGPTLFHLSAGLMGILVGRVLDRQGPRLVLLLGAGALGAGALALGLTRQLWHTYPAFGLLGVGFACVHTVTLGKIVARWFVRQRARALALATLGASLGGTLLVPLNATVLQHWGGLAGGCTLALLALVVIVPLALWVIKDGPEAYGLHIDGDLTPELGAAEITPGTQADAYPWSVSEAMRTTAFWALASSFSLGMVAQSGFLVHQVLLLQETFGLGGAAGVVTVTTLAGTVGRLGFICLSHAWAPRWEGATVFLIQALGLLFLALGDSQALLLAGSALFGLSMGIVVTLQPLLTAQCFGRLAFGRIYGPIYLGIRLGAACGPLAFGLLAAATGSYRLVLLLAAGGLGLATLAMHWARPPQACPRPSAKLTEGWG